MNSMGTGMTRFDTVQNRLTRAARQQFRYLPENTEVFFIRFAD